MSDSSMIENRYANKLDSNGGTGKTILIAEEVRIKHKDKYNMKYVYMMCHEWFIEHGWGPSSDSKWPERFYLHRWNQSGGQEIWVWWRFHKYENDLLRYDFDVDWHIVGMESADIIKDGKKFKGNKGDCEIKIFAKIIMDPDNKLASGPFGSFKQLLFERIYYKTVLKHKREVYEEVFKFKQILKTYFNMPTYLPDVEGHNFWQDDNAVSKFYDKK